MNESLNKNYFNIDALEIITYYPEIFSKAFLTSLQKSNLPIDSKTARSIRDKMIDDYHNTSNLLYNGIEFTINVPKYQKEIEFSLKVSGARLIFKVRNVFSRSWEFNLSKMTLGTILSKIEEKLKVFENIDSLDYKEFRKKLEELPDDLDQEKSNSIRFNDLDSYLESITKKYKGFTAFYSAQLRGNRDSTISLTIKFEYLKYLFQDDYSSIHSIRSFIKDELDKMEYKFHKEELKKIIKNITNFCKRRYDIEFFKYDLNSSLDRYEMYGSKYRRQIEDSEIEETLSIINDEKVSNRNLFYISILEKIFKRDHL